MACWDLDHPPDYFSCLGFQGVLGLRSMGIGHGLCQNGKLLAAVLLRFRNDLIKLAYVYMTMYA